MKNFDRAPSEMTPKQALDKEAGERSKSAMWLVIVFIAIAALYFLTATH